MHTDEKLTALVSQHISVSVRSVDREWPLSNEVYAVNWFDTRSLLLYNIYNWLAARSVRQVKGRPIIKGHVTTILHGSKEDSRNVLLIVNYPAPLQFLTMVQTTYFKLVSLLRLAAVRDFTFGFSRPRITLGSGALSDAYAVHHFRGEDASHNILSAADDAEIDVYFGGSISARIASGGGDDQPETAVPCLMDGIVVLKAGSKDELREFIDSKQYRAIIARSTSSFIALFDRVL